MIFCFCCLTALLMLKGNERNDLTKSQVKLNLKIPSMQCQRFVAVTSLIGFNNYIFIEAIRFDN